MIKRERYLERIRDFYDSDLIKIITGIRRSGKTIILEQIMEEIREKTENIIYLNFEDRRITAKITYGEQLTDYIEENRKEGKCYLFFDEIQLLDGWQEACKTLRLYDYSVFITGSNSKLLSGEFTKELSGRYVAFRVRPFVYKEITEYAEELGKEVSITDYLVWGGFPKRFEFSSEEAQRRYLSDLDDTIIINDLLQRYKIKKDQLFKNLVNFVLRSNGKIFSAKSIRDYVKKEYESCSVNTIMKYLSYLEEAYIIESVRQYSTKTKRELNFYTKIYDADVVFNSLRCMDNRYDLTHNLENIVYNELIYMDYNVYVYNNNGREIDFLAQREIKNILFRLHILLQKTKPIQENLKLLKAQMNL